MSRADLVVVDTNILLSATDRSRVQHEAARTFLREDPRDLHLTPQVAREYLAVATRPAGLNGLGLAPEAAVANVRELLRSLGMLHEGTASTAHLLRLVADGAGAGRQVHDATLVAVALAHGAAAVVTDDTSHFARFADHIRIERLPV